MGTGGRGDVRAFQGDEEGIEQAGREAGGVARRRVGHTPILLSRTKTTEEGPVGWAGAGCCWARGARLKPR